jgi:hypothetical protein
LVAFDGTNLFKEKIKAFGRAKQKEEIEDYECSEILSELRKLNTEIVELIALFE